MNENLGRFYLFGLKCRRLTDGLKTARLNSNVFVQTSTVEFKRVKSVPDYPLIVISTRDGIESILDRSDIIFSDARR